jgi:hypothetical protein
MCRFTVAPGGLGGAPKSVGEVEELFLEVVEDDGLAGSVGRG